ncbi:MULTISPECIES: Uma2 family endonuclease [Fischerella]|uniref:Uma2 family endonuclease n=1 Tax=Fischerella TaxID=1190 RepID=UPI000310B5BE|nr:MULTISPECIES: Uma2 family endonuclease [Fischerella]
MVIGETTCRLGLVPDGKVANPKGNCFITVKDVTTMYTQAQFLNLSVDEYFKLELESFTRHEYIAGQVYPILGETQVEKMITENIFTRLRTHLYGTNFRTFSSNMKVKLEPLDIFYYPEIFVTSNYQDIGKPFKTHPCLIVEVISSITERIDRNEKLFNYQQIDSLQEYILVSQSHIQVDIYRKDNQNNWFLEVFKSPLDSIEFSSVDLTILISEIYEDIELNPN